MPTSYRIAGRLSSKDLTLVGTESQFARSIRELFTRIRPRRVIETGTYFGTGTTTVIASTLRDLEIDDARFVSIEINPRHYARAQANLERAGLNVELLHGLSVPRLALPTREQIERELIQNVMGNDLVVDHEEADRVRLYFGETDFPDLPDDLLGLVLRRFNYKPDFVLLDSGGHMGHVEFRYLVDQLRGPCHIAMDDIYHVKHHRSFQDVQRDRRFKVVSASEEKFGFCIAKFDPNC